MMMKMNFPMRLAMVNKLIGFILVFLVLGAQAKEVPKAPTKDRWVQDYGNVLELDQEIFLKRKLQAYYDSTSTEIAIVTEYSLDGDDIFEYSHRLAEAWGIGKEGKDNGILIYAAIHDKKVYIQVGYGLEGAVPDAYAKRIINEHLRPNFREGRYGKGFNEATDVIIKLAEGEFVFDDKPPKEGIPIWVIILIILVLLFFFSSGGNSGRTYKHSPTSSRPPFWLGGGGSSFGGGGSGGFGGGFGGGSFGGGGAGGSW
jgi:uncharacterized protein